MSFALFLLLTLGMGAASAQNQLQSVDVQNLSGQQTQVRLQMSGPAPEPTSFTMDQPHRISIDLAGATLALPSRRIDVRAGGLSSITAAEAGGKVRLVLNLDGPAAYTTRVDGNSIIVTLGAPAQAAASTAPRSTSAPAAAAGGNSIRNIEFRRTADGAGRVIVEMSHSSIPVNVTQQGNRVLLDFGGADLPQELMRRFDVLDFATPVQSVDALRTGGGTRLAILASGDFEQLSYQADNIYSVEIRPISLAAAAKAKKEYTGQRLTLDFHDIEIRALLRVLADTGQQNIAVNDSVQGNMTLTLKDVPWDQALDVVMKLKGLDMRRDDNVIIVGPVDELAADDKARLAADKEKLELAPLRTEPIQINYARAAEIRDLIKSSADKSLLSPRGSVNVYERNNVLMVQDTADRLDEIRSMIARLDIPPRQVQIEARIVIVNDDFERNLGVRWGTTMTRALGPSGTGVIGSGGLTGGDDDSGPTLGVGDRGEPPPITGVVTQPVDNRYLVNLPVADPAGRIALTLLDSEYIVDLELSAAEAEGRGEVISRPSVLAMNNVQATLDSGVEIPYQEAASSGATTVSFKKATLGLTVTPQITPDNRIIMTLEVKKDSVGAVIVSSAGADVPSIDTRVLKTNVSVNDGETVVMGGILETEQRHTETKVPVLGDIPVLGRLFKNISKTNNKDELLIFITARIVRDTPTGH